MRLHKLTVLLVLTVLLLPAALLAAQDTNTAPDAVDDSATTAVDTPVVIEVLENDTDAEGNLDPASVVISVAPVSGTLSDLGGGVFEYTPNAGFLGIDTFIYTVCDTLGLCDSATVTINVVENTAPQAVDDLAAADEDTPVVIDVVANDVDAENNLDPSSVTVTDAPANGTAVSNGDGTVTYTPGENFSGTDSFTYEVCDTGGLCDSATVTIEVTPVNDAPDCASAFASPASIWPPNHQMVSISVLGVTDADADEISIMITGITSSEADNAGGDGNTSGDTAGVGTNTAQVRAERAGGGSGRVYVISFTADDGQGGICDGTVMVSAPHDQRDAASEMEAAVFVEEAPAPGNFGCDGPGNSCNAPGRNQSDNSSAQNTQSNSSKNEQKANNGNRGGGRPEGNGPGNGNGNGNNGNGRGRNK